MITKHLRVGLGALLAKYGHKMDKALVTPHLLGPTSPRFLLFGHFGSLNLFPSTGQGTVDFTSKHAAGYFQSGQNLYPALAQGSVFV